MEVLRRLFHVDIMEEMQVDNEYVCRCRGEDKIIRGEELKVLEESSIWILKFTRKITGMAVDT